jgi:hypothetical protein
VVWFSDCTRVWIDHDDSGILVCFDEFHVKKLEVVVDKVVIYSNKYTKPQGQKPGDIMWLALVVWLASLVNIVSIF